MRYLFLIVLMVSMVSPLYGADYYAVINADGSIHTIEEKPHEVLQPGMTRHTIHEWCDEGVQYYDWDNVNKKLKLKSQADRDAINAVRALDIKIAKSIDDAKKEKDKQEAKAIAQEMLNDMSLTVEERLRLQEIINQ